MSLTLKYSRNWSMQLAWKRCYQEIPGIRSLIPSIKNLIWKKIKSHPLVDLQIRHWRVLSAATAVRFNNLLTYRFRSRCCAFKTQHNSHQRKKSVEPQPRRRHHTNLVNSYSVKFGFLFSDRLRNNIKC